MTTKLVKARRSRVVWLLAGMWACVALIALAQTILAGA